MRVTLFAFLAIYVSASVTVDDNTSQRSSSEKDIELKQEKEYQENEGNMKGFEKDSKSDTIRVQGDMILTKEQLGELTGDIEEKQDDRAKRQAYVGAGYPNNLWPDNKVYYGFYSNATDAVKRVIKKAAAEWAKDTCLQFEEVQLSDVAKVKNIIGVYSSFDCFSRVGKIGGIQGLSLGRTCETVGHAAHELGHALGFIHTHMRYDRDKFIKVNQENIVRGWENQFWKQKMEVNNNYNVTYDFGSVMQYPATSESRNGKNTMEPYDEKYLQTLGSHMISFYDKLMMNRHYKCLDKCKNRKSWFKPTASCRNGGFPNPKDCTTCVCPSGYGGKLCDKRPNNCGKTLLATTKLQTLRDTVGYGRHGIGRQDEYKMCTYWIEGLPGSTIEIKLVTYDVTHNSKEDEGCRESGVEIKTRNDTGLTGYRFCRYGFEKFTFRSTNHVVPVVTYSAIKDKDTVLTYQIVSFDPKFECKDSKVCPLLKKFNICESKNSLDKMKRKFCAKSCGFCM